MSDAHETLVILATYNEIENLPALVEGILAVTPEVDVLVVDDDSPDGTGRWSAEQAAAEPRLRCIHRHGKRGLGSATIEGLKFGLEHGYRRLVTMDADHSHPPRYLPQLLAASDEADVVIGSRYCRGGRIEGWPFWRHATSRGLNAVARWLLGLTPLDCSGAYRCYRREILQKIDLDGVEAPGYAYLEEILWQLKRAGARFAERPITFVNRCRGDSKVNWREGLAALGVLAALTLRRVWPRS